MSILFAVGLLALVLALIAGIDKPYTITAIEDIPLSDDNDNILLGKRGQTLTEKAIVLVALNRETVDVTAGVTVGTTDVLSAGSAVTVQATVGVLPVLPDDIIVTTMGNDKDEIIVSGRNADAVAARELRAIVKVIAIEDQALLQAVAAIQGITTQSLGI